MQIQPNCVVTVHYTLTEGTAEGRLVESTAGDEPLGFIFGNGSMIPTFESNLAGLKAGDAFAFAVAAAEAYGVYDEAAIFEVEKAMFVDPTGKVPDGVLTVGNVLPLRDPQGNMVRASVKAIGETSVTLDLNHPMAGVDLYFTGKVEQVRPADPDELQHGHLHGPGGHHH